MQRERNHAITKDVDYAELVSYALLAAYVINRDGKSSMFSELNLDNFIAKPYGSRKSSYYNIY